jgi:hypothetical protein
MESRRSGQLVVHVISLPVDVFAAIDEIELLRLERALVLPLRFKKSRSSTSTPGAHKCAF